MILHPFFDIQELLFVIIAQTERKEKGKMKKHETF